MKNISLSTKSVFNANVSAQIIFVEHDVDLKKALKPLLEYYPNLVDLAHQRNFRGAAQDVMVLPMAIGVRYVIIVGLGQKSGKTIPIESYRRSLSKGIRAAVGLRAPSIAVELPAPNLFAVSTEYLAEQSVIIGLMSTYHFDEFITQEDRKEQNVEELILCVDAKDKIAAQKAIKRAEPIARAVNMTRHWIDAPPLHMTPYCLAQKAQEIGKEQGLKVTLFDEAQITKMGMGGLAAVSKGSDIDCYLAILEYKTTKKNAPTVAIVGKGITFDSGGLSIKPAQSMETMKDDMSGAAAVIATMQVIAQLKPNINIVALAPISENLPSGKATKPGDIIRFYNGKTAEIKNTDAEGRLILADALSYAVKHYKPDAIIDIATLTGACAYALGPFYTGLMSMHDDLAQKLVDAGNVSGDLVWRLPMGDDYKKAIKSDVADICNIGDNRIKAGAITAAHFLQHFVEETPWAHLDIAGTAFDVPNIPYYRSGATGAGVRLLVELLMNW
jgi:leucyl aminopeptidase